MVANQYSIKEKLGQGSSCITYSAIDTKSDRAVAIKVLSLSSLDNWKKVELFEREAKILQQLNHPAIPKYLDYFQIETEDNIDFCLVQELAPGQSLGTLINNGWQPDETTIRNIAEKVLDVLIYLQQLTPPVIHRDIKPQNIIYQPDTGKLFLVDFGAVKDIYHHTVSTVVGTYGYMAPEQHRGNAILSTDLYGLGCTLLFLLTGQSPAELPHRKLKINFRSMVNLQPDFTKWIEELIEPNIENRFQNAKDALDVLFGNTSTESYKTQQIYKPDYTSVYFVEEQEQVSAYIPPALFWKKHSFNCLAWTLYYIFIFVNIGILSLTNSWVGYVYGIIIILSFFSNLIFSRFLQIVSLTYLVAFLILVVFVWSELVQLIPLLVVFFDTLIFHKMRNKIIKDFWFPTRLKLVSNRFTKYFKLERKLFSSWNSEGKFTSEKEIEQGMNVELDSVLLRSNSDYQFGCLLSHKEKKWLIEELKEQLRKG